jgi:NTP pyrophosphatase (non-canonical NTP hydrolase)
MTTFDEYQALATKVPVSLRNNLDRLNFPAMGLQEEAGKISLLLTRATATGHLKMTPEERGKLQERLADILWYTAHICVELDITLQDVAAHGIIQLQERAKHVDPDRR